jgi:hypothetical protein
LWGFGYGERPIWWDLEGSKRWRREEVLVAVVEEEKVVVVVMVGFRDSWNLSSILTWTFVVFRLGIFWFMERGG